MVIPLRCLCGNAVLRPRLSHEARAKECVTNLCPLCDDGGGFEETFYTGADGRSVPYFDLVDGPLAPMKRAVPNTVPRGREFFERGER